MKKIGVVIIVMVFGMIPLLQMVAPAAAESMNFDLVSMYDKVERVKVPPLEGVIIGVMDRKGLSIFDNGEIATTSCRGTFDTKKGFQGYSSIAFEDGSTLVLSWKGPTTQSRPAGGKYWEYGLAVEFVQGTGRFEGVKGSGTYVGKAPQWDEDYKAKGFTYYKFTGEYTLPAK